MRGLQVKDDHHELRYLRHVAAGKDDGVKPEVPAVLPKSESDAATDEQPERFGVGWLFRTWRDSLFFPASLYSRPQSTSSYWKPIILSIVVSVIVAIVLFWGDPVGKRYGRAFLAVFPAVVLVLGTMLSCLFHLVLRILNAAGGGFRSSFSVVVYSSSACTWIPYPVVGKALWIVWAVILLVVGLKTVHSISAKRAAAAILIAIPVGAVLIVAVLLLVRLVVRGI